MYGSRQRVYPRDQLCSRLSTCKSNPFITQLPVPDVFEGIERRVDRNLGVELKGHFGSRRDGRGLFRTPGELLVLVEQGIALPAAFSPQPPEAERLHHRTFQIPSSLFFSRDLHPTNRSQPMVVANSLPPRFLWSPVLEHFRDQRLSFYIGKPLTAYIMHKRNWNALELRGEMRLATLRHTL